MRIIRVSYRVEPCPGGLERHVAWLSRIQAERGHQVTLTFRHGTAPDGAVAVLPPRPSVLSLALRTRSDVLAFGCEATGALRGAVRPDLVHVHGDHVVLAALGPACRRLGIPLVLTVHGALNRRHGAFARWVLRHVDAFIALGARPAADLVALGADPARLLVTSSGLDLRGIRDARLRPPRQPGLIVSVGALDPVKGHALVIEAVRRLRTTRPRTRLVIAGSGPQRDRLARDCGDDDTVVLAGQLPRAEVYRLLERAEVFVLASRRLAGKGEGIPTSALEALAVGTPVVLSTDASLDPVVSDPLAYRTFRSGCVDDLVAVLGSLLDHPEESRRLSVRGPAAVADRDWPAVAAQIEAWYRSASNSLR